MTGMNLSTRIRSASSRPFASRSNAAGRSGQGGCPDRHFANRPTGSRSACVRLTALRLAVLLLLASALVLAGCGGSKLASAFDEAQVKQAARTAVDFMNTGAYGRITDEMVRDDLKQALSAQVLAGAAAQVLSGAGAFESFTNEVVAGSKSQSTGEDYAVAVLVAQYAARKVTYTISFDARMKLVGFYMK